MRISSNVWDKLLNWCVSGSWDLKVRKMPQNINSICFNILVSVALQLGIRHQTVIGVCKVHVHVKWEEVMIWRTSRQFKVNRSTYPFPLAGSPKQARLVNSLSAGKSRSYSQVTALLLIAGLFLWCSVKSENYNIMQRSWLRLSILNVFPNF